MKPLLFNQKRLFYDLFNSFEGEGHRFSHGEKKGHITGVGPVCMSRGGDICNFLGKSVNSMD